MASTRYRNVSKKAEIFDMSKTQAPKEEAWLAELLSVQRSKGQNDEGLTASEWGDLLGCHADTARTKLLMAKKAGVLRTGMSAREDLSGRIRKLPVYRIERK